MAINVNSGKVIAKRAEADDGVGRSQRTNSAATMAASATAYHTGSLTFHRRTDVAAWVSVIVVAMLWLSNAN